MTVKTRAIILSKEDLLLIEEALSILDKEADREELYNLHAKIVSILDEMEGE